MVAAVIPDPEHPEFSVFWLRDANLVYHPWLNELTVLGDTSLRPQMDDVVHALTRTQQVVSAVGNVFTGGLEEPVFDLHLNMIIDPGTHNTRIGAPAAGMSIFLLFVLAPSSDRKCRWPSFPRGCPSQVCRMVDQTRTEQWYLGY